MAKQTIIIDDIDGSKDAKSYTFALEGENYVIDLSGENFSKLKDALAPFIEAGEKVTGRATRSDSGNRTSKNELKAIREWAAENGHEVSPRGRIPQAVQDAYRASK